MAASAAPATVPSVDRARGAAATRHTSGGQTFARAVRAEWIKFRSLRSTWITSFMALAVTSLFGAGLTVAMAHTEGRQATAANVVASGSTFGQIVVAVLGALIITGEYSSGQIRSSLAAVPRRGRLLAAKAVVVSAHTFVLGTASVLIAWALSAPFMDGHTRSLADAEYLGQFWGTGLSFTGIALIALGLGLLLRSTAGAITTIMTLLFVIDTPLALAAVKWDWAVSLRGLEPSTVSSAVADPFQLTIKWGQEGTMTFLEHWQAITLFGTWILVPLIAGGLALKRRDA